MPDAVNARSKKSDILEAYREIKKAYETLKKRPAVPKEEKPPRKVEIETPDAVLKHLGEVKITVSRRFSEVEESLVTEVKRLQTIQEKIRESEKRIEELHAIDAEAMNLKEIFQRQKEAKQAFEEEIKEQRNVWSKEKSAIEAGLKEDEEARRKIQKRTQEEFAYTFAREKQRKEDTLTEELESRKRAFDEEVRWKEEELTKREAEIAAREEHIKALETQVESFPSLLEQKIKETEKAVIKTTEERLKMERIILEKDHERETEVHQLTINSLKAKIKEQEDRIKSLEKDLKQTMDKAQSLASIAIEGVTRTPMVAKPEKEEEES